MVPASIAVEEVAEVVAEGEKRHAYCFVCPKQTLAYAQCRSGRHAIIGKCLPSPIVKSHSLDICPKLCGYQARRIQNNG